MYELFIQRWLRHEARQLFYNGLNGPVVEVNSSKRDSLSTLKNSQDRGILPQSFSSRILKD